MCVSLFRNYIHGSPSVCVHSKKIFKTNNEPLTGILLSSLVVLSLLLHSRRAFVCVCAATEEEVSSALSELEKNSKDLSGDLKDLFITAAKKIALDDNKEAYVVFYPYRQRKKFQKIQVTPIVGSVSLNPFATTACEIARSVTRCY